MTLTTRKPQNTRHEKCVALDPTERLHNYSISLISVQISIESDLAEAPLSHQAVAVNTIAMLIKQVSRCVQLASRCAALDLHRA
jgi:hypothetical protein